MDPVFIGIETPGSQTIEISRKTVQMLRVVRHGFAKQDQSVLAPANDLLREVRDLERNLSGLAGRRRFGCEPDFPSFIPSHLGCIGEAIDRLAAETRTMLLQGVLFTPRATQEILGLMDAAIDLLEAVGDALTTGNRVLVRFLVHDGPEFESMANEFARSHEQRLIEGVCVPKASPIYLAMIDHLKALEWHARQIGQKLCGTLVDYHAGVPRILTEFS